MKALEILNTLISSQNDDVFANKNYYEKLTFIAQAIEELEDLENRSCDNCEFSVEHERYQGFTCKAGVTNYKDTFKVVDYDFCCNKWESINENT